MSSGAAVNRWVDPGDLLPVRDILPPLPSKLRNSGGPTHALRKATGDLREEGSAYDERELPDDCVVAGVIYFHPGTRKPPIPPFSELEAFMAANPNLPIVVDSNRPDKCEYPHIVFAQFVRNGNGQVGLDRDDNALIRLFTIAASNASVAFNPATHVKNGTQYEGVDILDWNMVNFERFGSEGGSYAAGEVSCRDIYRRLYHDLYCML